MRVPSMLHKVFTGFDYLGYLIKSNSLHGTHSPFVYHWADSVLYAPKLHSHHLVEWARTQSLNSRKKLDFEAGKSLHSWVQEREPSSKYGQLLRQHILQHRPQRLLHYGTGLGLLPAYCLELEAGIQPEVHAFLDHAGWLPYLQTTLDLVAQPAQSWQIHADLDWHLTWDREDLILIDAVWLSRQNKDEWFECWDRLSVKPQSVWIYNVQHSETTRNWASWLRFSNSFNIGVDLFWTICLFDRPEQASEQFTLRY